MSDAYQKLIKTLRTVFEMDKADLDFGIYRILNQKREEITRFLEKDLLPQDQLYQGMTAGLVHQSGCLVSHHQVMRWRAPFRQQCSQGRQSGDRFALSSP